MPGLYLLMYIERVPNDSTSLVKAVSIPLIIEAISITVTTPMITPMTVRNERSLLARRVPSANQRFSKISLRNNFIVLYFVLCPLIFSSRSFCNQIAKYKDQSTEIRSPPLKPQSDQAEPLSRRERSRTSRRPLPKPQY